MNVLAADKLDASALAGLEAAGFTVSHCKGLAPGNLPAQAAAAEILIVRSTLVPKDLLPGLPSLKLIIRAGAGTDTIDVAAASARASRWAIPPARMRKRWRKWLWACCSRPIGKSWRVPRPCGRGSGPKALWGRGWASRGVPSESWGWVRWARPWRAWRRGWICG